MKQQKNAMSAGRRGFAQIPLMIGLLLMAVAIPAVTSLVQNIQDTRNKASYTGNSCNNGRDKDGSFWCAGQYYTTCNNGRVQQLKNCGSADKCDVNSGNCITKYNYKDGTECILNSIYPDKDCSNCGKNGYHFLGNARYACGSIPIINEPTPTPTKIVPTTTAKPTLTSVLTSDQCIVGTTRCINGNTMKCVCNSPINCTYSVNMLQPCVISPTPACKAPGTCNGLANNCCAGYRCEGFTGGYYSCTKILPTTSQPTITPARQQTVCCCYPEFTHPNVNSCGFYTSTPNQTLGYVNCGTIGKSNYPDNYCKGKPTLTPTLSTGCTNGSRCVTYAGTCFNVGLGNGSGECKGGICCKDGGLTSPTPLTPKSTSTPATTCSGQCITYATSCFNVGLGNGTGRCPGGNGICCSKNTMTSTPAAPTPNVCVGQCITYATSCFNVGLGNGTGRCPGGNGICCTKTSITAIPTKPNVVVPATATPTKKPGGGGNISTSTPKPGVCMQCPSDFKCYRNGAEYRWFVSGYVPEGFTPVSATGNLTAVPVASCKEQCPGTDGVLRNCHPPESDGSSQNSLCNLAGRREVCGTKTYCCPTKNGKWTADLSKCPGTTATPPVAVNCGGVPKPTFKGRNNGDANCDGRINALDLSLWQSEFMMSTPPGTLVKNNWFADFTGPRGVCDGLVNAIDLATWQSKFYEFMGKN